ncbi:hypothetical protein QJS66_04975 [Kocuria rhizophila]|nr:hypothetical protein QJS66_04975 [Kocuria rhizophila]
MERRSRTWPARSCSSWRVTPRWARPGLARSSNHQACCPSAARSSTCRRPPSRTCWPTPSAPR